MRPGEIFGLKWAQMEADYADIRQRIYRGDVDSPKSVRSVRFAALSGRLLVSIDDSRAVSLDTSADAWFPIGKAHDALGEAQLLETELPAQVDADWSGLGKLPGDAADPQLPIERAGYRSAYPG